MLTRRIFAPTLLAVALAATTVSAQGRDKVIFRDKDKEGKVTSIEGETKENGAGVEVIDGVKRTKISAPEMIRIDYADASGADRSALLGIIPFEDSGRDPMKCATEYTKLVRGAATAPDKTKRYLAFREAYWLSRAASLESGEKYTTACRTAAGKLVAFTKAYPRSWESWHTAREAARLYVVLGESTAALDAIKLLGANTDLTPELKIDTGLLRASYLFRSGDPKTASETIADISKEPKLDDLPSHRARVDIFQEALKAKAPPATPVKKDTETDEQFAARQEEATKAASDARTSATAVAAKVEAAVAKTKDSISRAFGYNVLGDLYLMHGLAREAMWAYLWVDTVYSQDKDEHIKAVARLVAVFSILKDDERKNQFEDRLQKIR